MPASDSQTSRPNLRKLGRWLAALTGMFMLALLIWLPGHLVLRQADALEARSLDREARRVASALRGELLVLEDLCRDWSDWDDTYRFVQDRNPAFAKANLEWTSLIVSTRVHLITMLDPLGKSVWGGFRTTPDGPNLPLPTYLAGERPLPRRNGILLTPHGPLLISIRPILQSNGTGPSRGFLAMGRLLDDASLARIRLKEQATFRVQDTLRTPPTPTEAQRLLRLRNGTVEVDLSPKKALVHALVPDLERKGGLWMQLTAERDIHLQGRRAAFMVSGALGAAFLLVAGVLAASFRRYHTMLIRHQEDLREQVEIRTQELVRANRALEEASMVDLLTGLRNRRYAVLSLPEDVALTLRTRHPGQPIESRRDLIFFVVDLDHFKNVNDTHGHAAGDAVLRQVGDLLRRCGRGSDLAVRWGGEEFLVVARQSLRSSAATLAANLIQAFRDQTFDLPGGKSIPMTCSVGYCAFPVAIGTPDGLSFEQSIILADLCMYAAKRSGRNGYVGFLAPDTLDPTRLLDVFPRGFIQLAKAGILEVQCSSGEPAKLTWV